MISTTNLPGMAGKVTATSLPLQKNARAPMVTGAVSRPRRARARGAAAGGRQRCAASRRLPPQPRPWRRPAGPEAMEPRRPPPGPRSPPPAACRCRAQVGPGWEPGAALRRGCAQAAAGLPEKEGCPLLPGPEGRQVRGCLSGNGCRSRSPGRIGNVNLI